MLNIFFILILTTCVFAEEEWTWNRWEKRTVDCNVAKNGVDCIVLAPNANSQFVATDLKCRREPMPQTEWNGLARNSTTRVACPLGCAPDFDLSVLTKVPYDNDKCQKYYTYGKYRDEKANDWFIWMTEPCVAAITTHCRFKDVPLIAKSQRKHKSLALA